MISRLPKENALLLRYLLAMLHGIQGNAQENQMTSFNLSVCIAPSMLWPPGAPCSTEAEGEGTKKVSVRAEALSLCHPDFLTPMFETRVSQGNKGLLLVGSADAEKNPKNTPQRLIKAPPLASGQNRLFSK